MTNSRKSRSIVGTVPRTLSLFFSAATTSLIRPVAAVGLSVASYPAVSLAYRTIKFLGVHKRVQSWVNKRVDQLADRLSLRRPDKAFRRARKLRR